LCNYFVRSKTNFTSVFAVKTNRGIRLHWLMQLTVFAGLLLVVGIGVILGIILGFSMLAVAVTIIKR